MAEPYLSMIEAFAFSFAPQGWALCAGQTLAIAQNQALFALLGTTFGGNGVSTFNLPDLRGRIALAFGQGTGLSQYNLSASGGEEGHQLVANEVPTHTHTLNAVDNGRSNGSNVPSASVLMGTGYRIESNNPVENIYSNASPTIALASSVVGTAGSGLVHENRMPFLTINYCIALQGIFPTQN